jgi:hypothetical protein
MSERKFIERLTGYKATDKNLRCLDFQFVPGEWHVIEGDIELCARGFHFCDHPSGPWAYYDDPETRIWKVEAEQVLDLPTQPGADHKRVCKRIRLVEELRIVGNYNTGDRNTGYRNTGNYNTGDRNTGYRNTGYRNTGNYNTGDRNTGDYNTGSCNTGDYNTGYRNTGYRNTGNYNTGDYNTGDGNATNHSSGFFCTEEPRVLSFDLPTNLTRDQYTADFPEYWDLREALAGDAEIEFERFKRLPNITPEKLHALHEKHKNGVQ